MKKEIEGSHLVHFIICINIAVFSNYETHSMNRKWREALECS